MSGTEATPLVITPGPLEMAAMGLAARVQTVFTSKRFNFEYVPARMTIKQWDRLGGLAPFVGLGWKGIPVRSEFESTFHAAAQFTVYLIAKNAGPGGDQARYLGDALGMGQLRMVQSAISILNGYSVPNVGPCFVSSAGNLWVDGWQAEGCALAGVDVQVGIDIDAVDTLDFGDVPLLQEIDTKWQTPEGELLIEDDDTMVVAEGGY
jgi:hypothetical protein